MGGEGCPAPCFDHEGKCYCPVNEGETEEGIASLGLPGGFGPNLPANDEIKQICELVQSQVEDKANQTFDQFIPVRYRSQVVAGLNYLIKVLVASGPDLFIHILINEDPTGELSVLGVAPGQSLSQPLVVTISATEECFPPCVEYDQHCYCFASEEQDMDFPPVRPGGFGPKLAANDEIKWICEQIQLQVEEKANQTFAQFIPVSYRSQVVGGMNYLIKVLVASGPDLFIHILVNEDLSGNLTVVDLALGMSLSKPLDIAPLAVTPLVFPPPVLPGSFGPDMPADGKVRFICWQVQPQVEEKANQTFDQFLPVSYRSQAVAGMNYLIKVLIGSQPDLFITILVNRDPSGKLTVIDMPLEQSLSQHSVSTTAQGGCHPPCVENQGHCYCFSTEAKGAPEKEEVTRPPLGSAQFTGKKG